MVSLCVEGVDLNDKLEVLKKDSGGVSLCVEGVDLNTRA